MGLLRALDFGGIASGLRVTFSAGLAHCDAEGSVELAIERADQAMHRAGLTALSNRGRG